MPRYIDADLEVKKINNTLSRVSDKGSVGYFALEEFRHMLEIAHTADVVPKSEVEELQSEVEELQAKVARLRKENVELLVSKETEIHISMEKLVRVRTEHPIFKAIEEKVAREIFEEVEKWLATDGTLLIITAKKFAEIKNKYTEE